MISPRRVADLYRQEFYEPRREHLFLSSIAFFAAFAVTRGITHAIRRGTGPFRDVSARGRHIHHQFFGILGLLLSGYLWLMQAGTGKRSSDALSRATSLLYGVGSAVTLDEIAGWLNLEDVYWAERGRQSVDAVFLFGGALSIGLWGGPFFRSLVRELKRL